MRPAWRFRDRSRFSIRLVERAEPAIGIGLKDPAIPDKMLCGMDAGSIRRVEEHGGGRCAPAEGTVVADIGPDPPRPGLHLRQHRHGGVVAVNALGGEDVFLDELVERPQHSRAGTHMIRERRDRELDPLARIVLALAVERLVVGVFFHQHHGQEARTGKAARDRMERRRRLRDLLAGPARELLPDMLRDEPLPRNDIERLGDILSDLRQLRAAAARASARRRVHDAPARQVGGKVAPCRLAPRKAFNLDARRFGLGVILPGGRGQLLELQFQLIDKPLAALGARPEHRSLHLVDQ
ncbi:hypothetical protein SAMN05444161_8822 [Rhizobiales bacterium GAS191]|nr:hypothetical protein SAMN05444161_8822 [Rhizobiales bacterium GAS191]